MNFFSFFTPVKINRIEDYSRFRNTRAYIQHLSSRFESTEELMEKSGYAKPEKFKKHREEFDNLERWVPLKYLDAIGVNHATLKFCGELDHEEFEEARKIEDLYPQFAIERLMPAIYSNIRFPEGITEDEAIEYLVNRSAETGKMYFINYYDFKTVIVNRDSSVNTVYHPPLFRITKSYLIPETTNNNLGNVRIR